MGTKISVGFANTLQKQKRFSPRSSTCVTLPGVKKGLIKGEALWLLRTPTSQSAFEKNVQKCRKSPDRKTLPCRYCETGKQPLNTDTKKLPFRTQSQYQQA